MGIKYNGKTRLNFGKHSGRTMDELWDVDGDYMCWMLSKKIIQFNTGEGNCREAVDNVYKKGDNL